MLLTNIEQCTHRLTIWLRHLVFWILEVFAGKSYKEGLSFGKLRKTVSSRPFIATDSCCFVVLLLLYSAQWTLQGKSENSEVNNMQDLFEVQYNKCPRAWAMNCLDLKTLISSRAHRRHRILHSDSPAISDSFSTVEWDYYWISQTPRRQGA